MSALDRATLQRAAPHLKTSQSALVAETFRMGGHATHDEAEARHLLPAAEFAAWGKRDPIGLYEEHLVAREIASRETLAAAEAEIQAEVEAAAEQALASRDRHMPPGEDALGGVYAS